MNCKIVFFLFLLSVSPCHATNWLVNGGFESYSNDAYGQVDFTSWSRGCGQPGNVKLSSTVKSGKAAISEDEDVCVVQNISAAGIRDIAGQRFTATCWINYGYPLGGESGALEVGSGLGLAANPSVVANFPVAFAASLPSWKKVTVTGIAPALSMMDWLYLSAYSDTHVTVDACDFTVWGAKVQPVSVRPSRAWLNSFSTASKVTVTTSIAAALAKCPATGYCELQVNRLILAEPASINRSNTRIVGMTGNRVTFPASNEYSPFFVIPGHVGNIAIEGLNIDGRNNDGTALNRLDDSSGILVEGEGINNIYIKGNYIHHISTSTNAYGIGVRGTGGTAALAINNLIVDGNTLDNLKTGSSENISVGGNVIRWEIVNNAISNANNIAIDVIGGEGIVPPVMVNNRWLPSSLDVARNGFVERNTVRNMSIKNNPAYKADDWAAAIYVDGGQSVTIRYNTVDNTPWGYEVGAENCVVAKNIWVEGNTSKNSLYGDSLFGGYASGGYLSILSLNCDPLNTMDTNEGHGYVENITVKGNTFSSARNTVNQSYYRGNVVQQYRVRKAIINQNSTPEINFDNVVLGDANSIRNQ